MLVDKTCMELQGKEFEVFEGLMLSDASLYLQDRRCNARFTLTSKHPEFVKQATLHLQGLHWGKSWEGDVYDKRTTKSYHRCVVTSLSGEWLTGQRHRWYPDGIKIVPPDVKITPTCLLWWYLGDGSLNRKKSRPNYRRVCLCTDSFTDDEREMLIGELEDMLGVNSVYPESKHVIIGCDAMVAFAHMMTAEVNPVSVYGYKFEFGQYCDPEYKKNSYMDRPLSHINEFRKANKVRELHFINKQMIERSE